MKVEIDQDKCVAAGQCVLLAPAVFDQREDDGIVELLQASPPESEKAATIDAVSACPAAAIWLAG